MRLKVLLLFACCLAAGGAFGDNYCGRLSRCEGRDYIRCRTINGHSPDCLCVRQVNQCSAATPVRPPRRLRSCYSPLGQPLCR